MNNITTRKQIEDIAEVLGIENKYLMSVGRRIF